MTDFTKHVGEWAWSPMDGWAVIRLDNTTTTDYPIDHGSNSFTSNGFAHTANVAPILFLEPPAEYNADPRPVCTIKKWQWLLQTGNSISITSKFYSTIEELEEDIITDASTIKKAPWTEIEVEV